MLVIHLPVSPSALSESLIVDMSHVHVFLCYFLCLFSAAALRWALEKVLGPDDRLTVVHIFEFVMPVHNPRGGVFVNMDTIV